MSVAWVNGEAERGEPMLTETDVRAMVRLLGQVAAVPGGHIMKKRCLMAGLAELIQADRWSWIVARADDRHHNPAVVEFLHDGFAENQLVHYVAWMQDREHVPVEYPALNALRRVARRFTRSWDQLVSRQQWDEPANRHRLAAVGIDHIMYSVHILDEDGLFSGRAWMRNKGRENFTPRQRRIAHIITSEVPWLHQDASLTAKSHEVRPLTPRLRTVLMLLIEGMTVKQIAEALGLSPYTVADYTKLIHKRFGVSSRAELLHHFMCGDGADLVPPPPDADEARPPGR